MRKLLVILMLIVSLVCRASAVEKSVDTLTKIENSILGTTYQDQKTEKRLNRLEEYVYGVNKKGNISERLKKLSKDLNADLIGQEIEPCEDTLAQTEYEAISDEHTHDLHARVKQSAAVVPQVEDKSFHALAYHVAQTVPSL